MGRCLIVDKIHGTVVERKAKEEMIIMREQFTPFVLENTEEHDLGDNKEYAEERNSEEQPLTIRNLKEALDIALERLEQRVEVWTVDPQVVVDLKQYEKVIFQILINEFFMHVFSMEPNKFRHLVITQPQIYFQFFSCFRTKLWLSLRLRQLVRLMNTRQKP